MDNFKTSVHIRVSLVAKEEEWEVEGLDLTWRPGRDDDDVEDRAAGGQEVDEEWKKPTITCAEAHDEVGDVDGQPAGQLVPQWNTDLPQNKNEPRSTTFGHTYWITRHLHMAAAKGSCSMVESQRTISCQEIECEFVMRRRKKPKKQGWQPRRIARGRMKSTRFAINQEESRSGHGGLTPVERGRGGMISLAGMSSTTQCIIVLMSWMPLM